MEGALSIDGRLAWPVVEDSKHVMPILFHRYFKVDFDMLRFLNLTNVIFVMTTCFRNVSTNWERQEISHTFEEFEQFLEGIMILAGSGPKVAGTPTGRS